VVGDLGIVTIDFGLRAGSRERAAQAALRAMRRGASHRDAFRAGLYELQRGMVPRIRPVDA
jgi:hypothetical protein